jgi:ABC-2 type transport system ATP-binding protein
MNLALKIQNLTKSYKGFSLENFNFSLKEGSCVGLIGENGAGKSTLIKSILGMVRRDRGKIVLYDGVNGIEDPSLIRERVGYVPEDQILYDWMSVRQTLRFHSAFYPSWDPHLSARLVQMLGLDQNKKVAHLSKGMKIKLLLILALSHRPAILLLDEPTAGLDPLVQEELIDYLEEIRRERPQLAILISSHILYDIEAIATEIAILHSGSLVLFEQKEELKRVYKIVQWHSNDASMINGLTAAPFTVCSAYQNGSVKLLAHAPSLKEQQTLADLTLKGAEIHSASVSEVYLGLVRHKIRL